ncbi:MAG: 30S ribosomal protein S9 [Bdellovibrionota bacterium]|nr:30S ribosomal protein S9 [Pseudobdellovibrionaceae bacterium]MEC9281897.1 30S ribosomal protein S9 [Bdellovibrionota bacterium]|tara:strand:+ start:20793 stop:21182 length:390 start_codon:yes stop_codon:yes gene_type:complete
MASTFYATGRRKTSSARVFLTEGSGKVTINGKSVDEYLTLPTSKTIINQPLELTKTTGKVDLRITVKGGGPSSQAGAIRHGISRALTLLDDKLHTDLKRAGFLTRDPRAVERKKYGKAKARRSFQFSKR